MMYVTDGCDAYFGSKRIYEIGGSSSSSVTNTFTETTTNNDNSESNVVNTTTINEASLTGDDLTRLLEAVKDGTVSLTSLGDSQLELQRSFLQNQAGFSDSVFSFAEDFGEDFFDFNTRAQASNNNLFNNALNAASGRQLQYIPEPDSKTGKNITFWVGIIAAGIGVYTLASRN